MTLSFLFNNRRWLNIIYEKPFIKQCYFALDRRKHTVRIMPPFLCHAMDNRK